LRNEEYWPWIPHIQKPVENEELIKRINEMMRDES
jgi:hypothetical protein